MFTIEKMTPDMHSEVIPMVCDFYHSDAVSHAVPIETIERVFADAVSDDPVLEGLILKDDDRIVGFAYLTTFYACEVGGRCTMIEELFVKEEFRGLGYGSAFLKQIFADRPNIRRYRLEASDDNPDAIRLYRRLGFKDLSYLQMARDMD